MIDCFLPRLDDLEVVVRQAGDRLALLVDDDDAEVHEIDRGAKRRLLRAAVEQRREAQRAMAMQRGHGALADSARIITPTSEDLVTAEAHDVGARRPSVSIPWSP